MTRMIYIAVALLVAASAVTSLGTASAESVTLGKCQPSGLCLWVCVADEEPCWKDGAACFSFSRQVPQCVPQLG